MPLFLIFRFISKMLTLPLQDMQELAHSAIQTHTWRQDDTTHKRKANNIFTSILSNQNLPESEKAFDRISHEGVVSVAAGGETTARAMTIATFFILSSNKTVLTRLQDELKSVMPETSSRPSLKELESLHWLVRCFKCSSREPNHCLLTLL